MLGACEVLGPPDPLPPGAERMVAPPEYAAWWQKTEECSARGAELANIEWYVVPGAATFPTDQGEKVGLWTRSTAGSRIIIAGSYRDNELVVRHEMLHELLVQSGHPPEYFIQRCHLTWESWGGP